MTLSALLRDLPWYVLFSLAGTSAAGFAKASIGRLAIGPDGTRDWGGAAWRFVLGCVALALNLLLLFFLLGRAEMIVMVPLSVGFNLIISSLIAIFAFREHIGPWKMAGMALIAIGVICIGSSG